MYIIYTVGFLASGACIVAVMRQKPSEEQKIMTGLTAFTSIAWLGYWLSLSSDELGEYMMANKVIYTGSCHLYFFLLIFICRFCKIKPPRMIYPILFTVNCMINVAALTMNSHSWFFSSMEVVYNGSGYEFHTQSGVFHFAFVDVGMCYCISIAGITMWAMLKNNQQIKSVIGLASAVLVPTVLNTLHALKLVNFDLTPIGYIISELILFILIYGSKLYDVQDTAREFIIDSLDDAIVVLDSTHRFKGCNEIAKELFPDLKMAKMDMLIDNISPHVSIALKNNNAEKEKEREMVYKDRTYRGDVRTIGSEEEIKGYVVWFTDVTEEVRVRELTENYQEMLKNDVDKKTAKIEKMQQSIIYSFASLVESRDSDTGEHVRRTSAYVHILAKELRRQGYFPETLSDSYVEQLIMAAPLHDIGKMVVPDSVLKKPGKLSKEEFEIMKQHTVEGGKILDNTLKDLEEDSYFGIAKEMAVFHHEKWNGLGYPYGIAGERIPIAARIMAVADLFDALTSVRPYKKAYSVDRAYSILEEESGRQLDPRMVECFFAVRPEVEYIMTEDGGALPEDDGTLSERDIADMNEKNM